MVALVLPLVAGLLVSILKHLELASQSGRTFREWIVLGFLTYVGIHVLLYRPVTLFRASHRIFSTLAVWLFGGQVSSVEDAGKGAGKGKSKEAEASPQGSTLVAFSPYVVPVYTIMACALGWVLQGWLARQWIDGPVTFLIGMTAGFHWLMTADDLQKQRSRWHLETYLLAIGLVFALTLVVGAACLVWTVPEFSFTTAFAEGLSTAGRLLTSAFRQLFA